MTGKPEINPHDIIIDAASRTATIDGRPVLLAADDLVSVSQGTSDDVAVATLPIVCRSYRLIGKQ